MHLANGKVYEAFYRKGVLVEGIKLTDMYVSYSGENNDIGQKNGYGIGDYRSRDTYEGECKDGKPEGFGLYLWVNSS
ncbi:hypothetical protein L1286_23625 [Pseudoalteromonas sp. SMS1]|uniref:hypothetical protein n=1 Tax=Pseudoalteromonas sp. SMS1 TaxID=2908894 RepID=UPI001F47626D|nr:hypothetical protein [Pseudoalteromonas sp. SMS1]MCF2860458.1 hypothetical protein [Pseudoalteromonas sp. SMS1]